MDTSNIKGWKSPPDYNGLKLLKWKNIVTIFHWYVVLGSLSVMWSAKQERT